MWLPWHSSYWKLCSWLRDVRVQGGVQGGWRLFCLCSRILRLSGLQAMRLLFKWNFVSKILSSIKHFRKTFCAILKLLFCWSNHYSITVCLCFTRIVGDKGSFFNVSALIEGSLKTKLFLLWPLPFVFGLMPQDHLATQQGPTIKSILFDQISPVLVKVKVDIIIVIPMNLNHWMNEYMLLMQQCNLFA